MTADIVTGRFCSSYVAAYDLPGSHGESYRCVLNGGEATPYCPCKSFQHSPFDNRTCKHIAKIHREACLWNEQWHHGNKPPVLWPSAIDERAVIPNAICPNCGGRVVAVKIAI